MRYESNISTIRWLIYDIPGNVGWILYLVCLIRCFVIQPEYMETPLVKISLTVGFLPAIAMAVGIVELISERILKLDRILPKVRLCRGFGALIWGGFAGMIVGLTAFFTALRAGYAPAEYGLLLLLAAGGALCAIFAGLIFRTFRPQMQDPTTHFKCFTGRASVRASYWL